MAWTTGNRRRRPDHRLSSAPKSAGRAMKGVRAKQSKRRDRANLNRAVRLVRANPIGTRSAHLHTGPRRITAASTGRTHDRTSLQRRTKSDSACIQGGIQTRHGSTSHYPGFFKGLNASKLDSANRLAVSFITSGNTIEAAKQITTPSTPLKNGSILNNRMRRPAAAKTWMR